MTPGALLERGLEQLALGMPSRACEKLLSYIELIAKWNRTYNLTAIREPAKMVTHHLLDCLAVVPHLPMGASGRLADAGSGAGLPGVPLAIARPEWHVTLNEASEKKAAFLRQAAIELKLDNVSVHCARVETWRPDAKFAVVISRAFAEIARFFDCCRHLLAPAGSLAAMKGAYPADELSHLPAACECGRAIPITVPYLRAQRHLVLCRVTP
ncbi:MAG TPA: 16S rRNA (guanine(527)-N(7))-methyltransferase RsmG [Burkholderiales bacterium]|nr:16S rRNA (guanine(527)-N(7))-methyltransferase RsmG [Burkholderiales bacterium]